MEQIDGLKQVKIALADILETSTSLDDTILDLIRWWRFKESKGQDRKSQAVPSLPLKKEKAKAQLPKLEFKKVSKRIHKWQLFWDSYQNAIHSNKLWYLQGLIEGLPRPA